MPLACRLNRLTPISCSNCWMARVRVDCEINTACAAAEIEPVSATAMKWRIWRRVIMAVWLVWLRWTRKCHEFNWLDSLAIDYFEEWRRRIRLFTSPLKPPSFRIGGPPRRRESRGCARGLSVESCRQPLGPRLREDDGGVKTRTDTAPPRHTTHRHAALDCIRQ